MVFRVKRDKETLNVGRTLVNKGRPATHAFEGLASGAEIILTLLFETGNLERLTVMKLRKGGGSHPLVDAPAFLRFDDPTYNDMLTGMSRLNRIPLPGSNSDLVIVADRKEVLPQDYVSTAVFIESRDPEETSDRTFTLDKNNIVLSIKLYPNGSAGSEHAIGLSLERRRTGVPRTVGIIEKDSEGSTKPFALTGTVDDNIVGKLNLRLFAYVAKNGLEPALDEHDVLTFTGGTGTLPLAFDVTLDPSHPANPSGYAMLRHDGLILEADGNSKTEHRISTPLYARGPVPNVIELVDPIEMRSGIVRRRAIYYWSSFLPAQPRGASPARFALLKSSGNGAVWLENRLNAGWQMMERIPTSNNNETGYEGP